MQNAGYVTMWKRVALVLGVIIVLAAVGVLLYFSLPYEGSEASIQSVEDDPNISVSSTDGVSVLEPANSSSAAGLVFYPGGRVAPNAYYGSLAPLVTEANVTVFIPEMPLNIALLNTNAAGDIQEDRPDIDTWFVGGHSLGGVAACQFAESNDVTGLVLFASYCNDDVSDRELAALSITGSADTVLDRDAYEASQTKLPAATTHEIEGMNHTQFGSYSGQRGDTASPLSYADAHRELADIVIPWLLAETA